MTTQTQVSIPQVSRRSPIGKFARNFIEFTGKNPTGAIGLFMILTVAVLASNAIVPWLQRYDPNYQDWTVRLTGPSWIHWLGTDEFGRDFYARLVGGASISMVVAFSAVFLGGGAALVIGVVSGYFGGVIDDIIQRLVEVMQAMPGILLALTLMSVFGPGIDKVIWALAIGGIAGKVRILRGTVLSTKENVYVEAARAIGCNHRRIMFRHIAPNIMAPFLIILSGSLGGAILGEASLSFLGLGVPPPHPSWGRMLTNSAANYALTAPWMVIFPGLAITWLVLGFNLFGDALRDIWDPRLRGLQ
ncbi:MAG: ABC transporter permease [Chloroflexi bacterium]|nr:ABC transporter permease [Chloroflexota bacterium]